MSQLLILMTLKKFGGPAVRSGACIGVGALVAVALSAAAAGGARRAGQPCDRPRSQTLLANRYIRVYRTAGRGR